MLLVLRPAAGPRMGNFFSDVGGAISGAAKFVTKTAFEAAVAPVTVPLQLLNTELGIAKPLINQITPAIGQGISGAIQSATGALGALVPGAGAAALPPPPAPSRLPIILGAAAVGVVLLLVLLPPPKHRAPVAAPAVAA